MKVISIRAKGYSGKGWEIQCIGPRKWVERIMKKFIPMIQKIK
jgi:hypothetical protein